jgi:hypothetical protein
MNVQSFILEPPFSTQTVHRCQRWFVTRNAVCQRYQHWRANEANAGLNGLTLGQLYTAHDLGKVKEQSIGRHRVPLSLSVTQGSC